MSSQRILVTGGAGFIGSHLVDRLVARGAEVVILDDLSTGERKNLIDAESRGAHFVFGSILDQDLLRDVMTGIDLVFHLAVANVRRSLGDPLGNHNVNATGTLTVLEAARRARVDRFVYCSSSEVYGNASQGLLDEGKVTPSPVTVYGGAKLAGEHYTKAYFQTYGLPTVVVRPFNCYGPREHDQGDAAEVIPRFVIRALNGLPPVIFGDGSAARDFTYVDDVVRGVDLASNCDSLIGAEVNIAFGRAITIAEVARAVTEAVGRLDLMPELTAPRPGDVHVLSASTTRAESHLGYRAEIGFGEGLGRYLEWFRTRHPDPTALLEADAENWTLPQ